MDNSDWIVFDGQLISADEPIVPAASRGLMYGDGVFETIRTYCGKSFCLQEHLERLNIGLEVLGMSNNRDFSVKGIVPQIKNLLRRQNLQNKDAIVRIQVWRDGQRGYRPDSQAKVQFVITAAPCPQQFEPVSLATVSTKRIPSEALPSGVKFTNGINYILAAREAEAKGADDALMQTVQGCVSETTIANIFWSIGNTFFTPSTNCDLIPGISRKVLIRIIEEEPEWGIKEGKFEMSELRAADAVFICNSVREVLAVRQIDQIQYPTDSVLLENISQRFKEFRNANLKDFDA